MDWISDHSVLVSIGLTLFSIGAALVLVFVKPRGFPIDVPGRIALGILVVIAVACAGFVYVGSSGQTQVSTPTAASTSLSGASGQGDGCSFAQELLSGNRVIQALDMPPGSGATAGYQIAFSRPLTIPEGWTIQIYGQTHPGPFSVAAGDIATIWSPESCRPLGANAAPTAAETPTGTCPPAYGYGDDTGDGNFGPGTVVKGPAALQAVRGSYELGQALGIPDAPRWGVNVPAGRTVTIPATIKLLGGQGNWAPTGFYETYASDADMARAQTRWLTYCP